MALISCAGGFGQAATGTRRFSDDIEADERWFAFDMLPPTSRYKEEYEVGFLSQRHTGPAH